MLVNKSFVQDKNLNRWLYDMYMESTPLKILTVEEIKKKSISEISELKKSIEEDIKITKYLSNVIEHGIFNKYLIYEKYIDELHNESADEDSDGRFWTRILTRIMYMIRSL